jgi:hypothetical protein
MVDGGKRQSSEKERVQSSEFRVQIPETAALLIALKSAAVAELWILNSEF